MRHQLTKIAAACALLAMPAAAHADPATIAAVVVSAAEVGSVVMTVVKVASIAMSIYGGIDARRRAKHARQDSIRNYNASVADRSTTVLQGTPPWRIVYGECITGGSIVAMFTTDKTTVAANGGGAATKPDGLKHLVILMASHEVEDLGECFIDGVSIGTLDGDGYSTSSDWTTGSEKRLVTVSVEGGSASLSAPASSIVSATSSGANEGGPWSVDRTVTIGGGGTTLTVTDGLGGDPVTVVYETALNPSVIRLRKHLGADDQTVDTYLQGLKPTEWDSSHRLRGCAYWVVTLDLEDPRFQGGPPNFTCKVKGKKLYDPRKDSTNGGSGSHRYNDPATWEWSDNNALCVRDWIVGEYGMANDNADVIDSFTIAAANACDVSITTDIGGTTATDKTYRCNGVATSDEDRESVLDKLADSMAGFAIYGAQWQILTGAWTAPVMDLTDDDLDGQIEVLQAGAGIDELVNGIRGTYIGPSSASPTDFEPYQNSTFVTTDGEELWTDVAMPFTNSKPHCANIARILVERGRNSQVIQYPAKLRAWPLQVGDRVTVTSSEYGITTPKTYRVTDWQFGLASPVTLALQEDAEDAYDLVDAVEADPTPNTDLPSPWVVETIALATPESGTDHLVLASDGTITTRVWVSWSELAGAFLKDGRGRVLIRWRRVGTDADWRELEVDASADGVYLLGAQDGDRLVIEAWAVNDGGWRGQSDTVTHVVVGKTAAPSNVSGTAVAVSKGRAVWAWSVPSDVDWDVIEIRSADSNWGSLSTPALFRGRASQWAEVVASAGSLTRYMRHIDTSGNPSASTTTVSAAVSSGDLVQDGAPGANNATVWLFQRTGSATPPAVPSGDVTYTFATGVATGIGSWAQALPGSGGSYRWFTTATASASTSTDTIATGEWATPRLMSDATGALAGLDTVGTGEIDTGAVTDTAVATVSSFTATSAGDSHTPDGEAYRESVISLSYTPPVDCIVDLVATGLWDYTTASGGTGLLSLTGGINISGSWSASNDSFFAFENAGTSQTRKGSLISASTFTLTGGVAYTFKLLLKYQNVAGGDSIALTQLKLARKVYKR